MTRKHFVAIAATLKDTDASRETCRELAILFGAFNLNFDYATFMDACGHGVRV